MMHATTIAAPVLAAGIDWLEGLLPFLFVVFWIVSQVWNVFRRANGRGAAPPVVPDPRRVQRPNAGPRPALEKEIEEFLRNVRGERPAGPPQPPPLPSQPNPQISPQIRPQPQRPKPPQRQTPKPPQPVAAASARPAPALRPDANRERRVGTFEAGETQVARHVHDAFAHELKHLAAGLSDAGPQNAVPAAPKPHVSQADELAHLLRSPASIRQAILLREVIDRPTHRW
jgi:hypothetical protein